MPDKKKLPEEVAGKYRVLDGHGIGEYQYRGQVVHLDLITLDEANKLVANGFPYLVPLPAKKSASN